VERSTQSPDNGLRPFVHKNLEYLHIHVADWEGRDQFCEALILTGSSTSIKSIVLFGEPSVLTVPVLPHSFSNLTSLTVSILSYKPSCVMGLVVWLKHAHQLSDIMIADMGNPGFLELFLQTLLINPRLPSSSIICPSLTHLKLMGHCMLLPSLFVRVISQRAAHVEQAMQSDPESPRYDVIPSLSLLLLIISCEPRLRDATLKPPYLEGESTRVMNHEPGAERVQEILNDMMIDIGCGEFDIDTFAEIADPEERFRELHSLLDLPAGDLDDR
jgi:hypothetical protein